MHIAYNQREISMCSFLVEFKSSESDVQRLKTRLGQLERQQLNPINPALTKSHQFNNLRGVWGTVK